MPPVDLSSKTITRLQKHAIPLVDTFDTVVAKLLDAFEANDKPGKKAQFPVSAVQVFDPGAPPNLAYTTVKYIKFCGVVFKPADTYWNTLMVAAIRRVAQRGLSPTDLKDHIPANCVVGQKDDNGYKYLPDVGISVQGQDANGAWKVTYHLAKAFSLPLEVTFRWQDSPKATSPNVTGSFTVSIG